jgi:hypothetical protein
MDVWEWLWGFTRELDESGRSDLVQTIRSLPSAAVGGETDRAEAMAVELIAQARSLELPWLEVFARHWRLQAFHTDERGASVLAEATATFEFAHRDETERCPQSVCVTQDLCIIYGVTDGPGFAAERIDVARETLDRIDPTWACWSCITSEWVSALVDAGQVDEAAEVLERQVAAIHEVGETPSFGPDEDKVMILIEQGRLTDALALIDDLSDRFHPGSNRERKAAQLDLQRANALSRLGRGDEAAKVLPTREVVEQRALNRNRWAATIERLVALGALENNAQLGATIHSVVDHARAGGAWRRLFEAAAIEARLAVARGAGWVAVDALETMTDARSELRSDAGADGLLADVRASVTGLDRRDTPLPVPADALITHLSQLEAHKVETEIEWLRQASEDRPDDADLVGLQAQLLSACGRNDLAQQVLEAMFERRPDSEPVALGLGEIILRRGVSADVDAFVDRIAPTFPTLGLWVSARQGAVEGKWSAVAADCAQIVTLDPDALNTRRLWASAARHLGDHSAAAGLLTEVLERGGADRSNPGDHWERMVDATLVGMWDEVHQSATALDITLTSESGPIDERWERIAVVIDREGGQPLRLAAQRTGPVTARIRSITPTNDPQRVGDLVVFDPKPHELPPADADEETRRSFIHRYSVVATIAPGEHMGWVIDGFHPGPDRYRIFFDALAASGVKIWLYSDQSYRITDPDGVEHPGLYGRIATPEDLAPADADALLTSLTSDWEHPMTWVGLAEAGGADVDRHHRAIEAYDL